jgi:hypothetical protein
MYVGLDIYRNLCYGTVMNEKGLVVERDRFRNDSDGLE